MSSIKKLLQTPSQCLWHGNAVRNLHTTASLKIVQMASRLRVVDNSEIGKQAMLIGKAPKVISVNNKKACKYGRPGDPVTVAILGKVVRGVLVGCKQDQKAGRPKFDTNNVVLVNRDGTPLGTRVHAPIPTHLRGQWNMKQYAGSYTKILSICTRFV